MQGDLYELKELPFIDNIPSDGRFIPSLFFFDEETKKFRVFIPYEGNYIEAATGGRDIVKGLYYSKKIAYPQKDIQLGFIEILSNHFSFRDPEGNERGMIDIMDSIVQDIHNFGAVIHKQFIIWEYVKSSFEEPSKSDAYDIYATEIEYLMGLIRSFFDLLYKIFIILSESSKPKLININLKKVNTLGKFADKIIAAIKNSEEEISQVDVLNSYELQEPFLSYFETILPFFRLSRKIRDAIYHSGKTPGLILITDNGPGISMQRIDPYIRDPFSSFKDFFEQDENFEDNLLENDICSLFYFVNGIIGYALDYAELFGQTMLRLYKELPKSVSNEHKIFIKGPEIEHIVKIPGYVNEVWLSPKK